MHMTMCSCLGFYSESDLFQMPPAAVLLFSVAKVVESDVVEINIFFKAHCGSV